MFFSKKKQNGTPRLLTKELPYFGGLVTHSTDPAAISHIPTGNALISFVSPPSQPKETKDRIHQDGRPPRDAPKRLLVPPIRVLDLLFLPRQLFHLRVVHAWLPARVVLLGFGGEDAFEGLDPGEFCVHAELGESGDHGLHLEICGREGGGFGGAMTESVLNAVVLGFW